MNSNIPADNFSSQHILKDDLERRLQVYEELKVQSYFIPHGKEPNICRLMFFQSLF